MNSSSAAPDVSTHDADWPTSDAFTPMRFYARELRASGLSFSVACERGYRYIDGNGETRQELEAYGFSEDQIHRALGGLLVPIYGPSGGVRSAQIKPATQRAGRPKYESPSGRPPMLDVPPRCRSSIGNPSVPLYITEGAKKADAAAARGLCVISLAGVWNWRGKNHDGGLTALGDWESVALNGRTVTVVFDSDATRKLGVHAAMVRIGRFLESRGASVGYAYLPCADDGGKVGLDDFLVTGGTVQQLEQYVYAEPLRRPASDDLAADSDGSGDWTDWSERYDRDLERAYRQMRISAEAREQVKKDRAVELWTPPATERSGTVAQLLERPREPRRYHVDGVLAVGHNVVNVGRYKAGKTTVGVNLAADLVDGTPFLGSLAVTQLTGRVGYWNAEMDEDDFLDYLAALGAKRLDRIAVLNLRGERVPLISDAGADFAVEWLRANDVQLWIAEPWSLLLSWSELGENDNDGARLLTQRIDEIKRTADVPTFFTNAHTGRKEQIEGQEHARGATVLDDWADERWMYTRDDHGAAFLRIEGRKVALDESRLDFDAATNRLTMAGGNRSEHRRDQAVQTVADIVRENPGISSGRLRSELHFRGNTNNGTQTAAMQAAENQRLVHAKPGPKNSRLWFSGPSPDDPLIIDGAVEHWVRTVSEDVR